MAAMEAAILIKTAAGTGIMPKAAISRADFDTRDDHDCHATGESGREHWSHNGKHD
jgi:hypothetical protein